MTYIAESTRNFELINQ